MFSLTKLLVLAALVLAVWYGFRWVGRLQQQRNAGLKAEREQARNPTRIQAEDMAECPVCGVYVPSHGAKRCGRANCPQG